MPLDADGFSLNGAERPAAPLKAPPPIVTVPEFFRDCSGPTEAATKMINELGKAASVERDGFDTMYRRLADALILILAHQEEFMP